ncbi:MAG: hypothetical protein ABIQ95_11240 [Bdellovibrionia bacterium]
MHKLRLIISALFLLCSTPLTALAIDPPALYFGDTPVDVKSGLGRDHALLEANQSPETQEFLNKTFFNSEGLITLEKVDAFLAVLHLEKEKLEKDLYESTILEQIEVDVLSQNKARKMARKMRHGAGRIVDIYQIYLIPTIEKLQRLVRAQQEMDQWAGLLQDFMRAYHVFYSPNSNVTLWPLNNSFPKIAKLVLVTEKFKKIDPKKTEAINLIVESDNQALIQDKLGAPVSVGHYLTKPELQTLKEKDFDLSLLNPGISGLWEQRTEQDILDFKSRDFSSQFPSETSTLIFKEVMLTGQGSPKIAVKEKETGRNFKVKWGIEAHIDNGLGNIFYILGFNVDSMQYKKEIKIHLGKFTYTQAMSLLQAKYGQEIANHTVLGRGGAPGREWIILKDVMLEARSDDDSTKTTVFDPTVIDFKDRREFNGRLLLYAYLNLLDAKIANMKMLLAPSKKTGENPTDPLDRRPRILLRMKDLGIALGPSMHLLNVKQIFTYAGRYLPDLFEEKGIVKLNRKKDRISLSWNDFIHIKGAYDQVTYSDLKWMARKIAMLSGDDLEWSLVSAGMPTGVAKIYRSKLISRRNEMIQSFELNEDPNFHFPQEIPNLPELNYQGDEPDGLPEVENGKIARSHYTGKQVYLKNKTTILYTTISQVGKAVELLLNTLTLTPGKTFPGANQMDWSSALISPEFAGAGHKGGLTKTYGEKELGAPIVIPLGVGISATLSRRVLITHDLHTDRDCKARPYYVRDTLLVSVGVGTPVLQKLLPLLPVELNGKIKVLEATYEYDHYTEDYLKGFITSPIPFFISLVRPIEQAATTLDRMEVIRRSLSFGLEAGVTSSLFEYGPVSLSRAQCGLGILKIDDRSYFRDQFGHLHGFSQHTDKKYSGIDLTIGQLSNPVIFRLPVMGYQNNHQKYKTEQRDWVAFGDQEEYSSEFPIEDSDGRLRDDLKNIKSSKVAPENLEYFNQNFRLQGTGEVSFHERILFLKGYSKEKRKTLTEIDYKDGHKKKLVLHATRRDNYLGIASNRNIIPMSDLGVKSAQRVNINIEADEFDYPGSVTIVRVMDFFRHGNREEVLQLIQSLNQRYSLHPESPLFRNYDLPEQEDIDDYRKLYGVTRIYLSTSALLDSIVSLETPAFESKVLEFFTELRERTTQIKTEDLNTFKRFLRKQKIQNQVHTLMKYFKELKGEAAKLQKDFKAISVLLDKFIFHQQIHKYGTGLLLQLLGEDSLFVTADIGGVFPSFSAINDLQERQRRRFVGYHWGRLNLVAPVQFHNRYERLLYSSDLIPAHISQDTLFGSVTNGMPEEFKLTF